MSQKGEDLLYTAVEGSLTPHNASPLIVGTRGGKQEVHVVGGA